MFSQNKLVRSALALAFATALIAGGLLAKQSSVEAGPVRQDAGQRTITVIGYGTAYSAPDIAYMSIGVENSNADVVAAVNDTNTRIQAVIDALTGAGIAPEDIRTEYYNIYQDSIYAPGPVSDPATGQEQQRTYRVTNVINVTVRDVGQIGTLLATGVNAGANIVNNISFDISERATLETQARGSAFQDATARATELATLLGGTLGQVISVSEGDAGFYSPVASARPQGGGAGDVPIAGGTLSVNVNLFVTFAIN
jgi:uncharacterized protein YggE